MRSQLRDMVGTGGATTTEPRRNPDYSAEYGDDGVDLTLIRWMLSLTPVERLEVLQGQVNAILAIRKLNAGE
jgi:hypothetical protein